MNLTVDETIKKLRNQKNVTQEKLAESLGVTPQAYIILLDISPMARDPKGYHMRSIYHPFRHGTDNIEKSTSCEVLFLG